MKKETRKFILRHAKDCIKKYRVIKHKHYRELEVYTSSKPFTYALQSYAIKGHHKYAFDFTRVCDIKYLLSVMPSDLAYKVYCKRNNFNKQAAVEFRKSKC